MALTLAAGGIDANISYAQEPAQLLALEELANDDCRGSSTNETEQVCAVRDDLVARLEHLGWCYGTSEQIEADKRWQSCESDTAAKIFDTEKSSSPEPIAPQQAAPVTAASDLPRYDTEENCKKWSTSKDESAIKMCKNNEDLAFMVLQEEWKRIDPEVRQRCLAQPTGSLPNIALVSCVEGGAP